MAVARSSTGGVEIGLCYVLPLSWVTPCAHNIVRNRRRNRRILIVTQQGAAGFDTATNTQAGHERVSLDREKIALLYIVFCIYTRLYTCYIYTGYLHSVTVFILLILISGGIYSDLSALCG